MDPDDTEKLLRVRSTGTNDDALTFQSVLDENTEPSESFVGEELLEPVQILLPCGHAFPNRSVDTVFHLLDRLDALLERHDDTTTPLETQQLRHQIHTIGKRLDGAVQRCDEQMETVNPDRCRQWQSEKQTLGRWN